MSKVFAMLRLMMFPALFFLFCASLFCGCDKANKDKDDVNFGPYPAADEKFGPYPNAKD